ncbi:hypothetical protein QQS45_01755 [Alteriqipengyuania flavescens]|uniref:hypothetical protein n=1 Tax=Alteriqipengyuania flavescens TaxID=3053610 RepID=UPI0025B5BC01|nr:hypothetical protein [Alteriqipengyuania flavescens]WJY18993.1 hypothetical protein QQW98_01750 [Alteriqipengyuania flavescens]WJY24934.1 hypothetical protein QQS45_01755 [Alteriqipengyuania flavescens]
MPFGTIWKRATDAFAPYWGLGPRYHYENRRKADDDFPVTDRIARWALFGIVAFVFYAMTQPYHSWGNSKAEGISAVARKFDPAERERVEREQGRACKANPWAQACRAPVTPAGQSALTN